MPFARKMEWAAFLDGATVRGSRLESTAGNEAVRIHGASAITPGVGFRYKSPVGPIRVDLGYNPKPRQQLYVVTAVRDSLGLPRLVRLDHQRNFSDVGTQKGILSIFNQVMLHLSIGQAY